MRYYGRYKKYGTAIRIVETKENMRHASEHCLCYMEMVRVVETGQVYPSYTDCARAIGGTVSGIHDCKSGRQRQHRGYHFEFLDEGDIYDD